MILFMIPNDAVSQEGYYNIDPDYKGKDLDADNLRLISWNEASYKKERHAQNQRMSFSLNYEGYSLV